MTILEAAYRERHTKIEMVHDVRLPGLVEVRMAATVVNPHDTM